MLRTENSSSRGVLLLVKGEKKTRQFTYRQVCNFQIKKGKIKISLTLENGIQFKKTFSNLQFKII